MSDSQITSNPTGKAETVIPDGPKPKTAKGKPAPRGVHVVFDGDGKAIAGYSGEVAALRAALEAGGKTKFVEYGQPF